MLHCFGQFQALFCFINIRLKSVSLKQKYENCPVKYYQYYAE